MSQRREVGANYFNTMLSQSHKNTRVIKNEPHVKSILSSAGKLHEENQSGNVDFMFSLLVNFGI